MLHTDDLISLHRLFGEQIPQPVIDEVVLRTSLYHSDGNHGRLGTLACIEVARSLGHCTSIPRRARPLESVDFHRIKLNTEVWVKKSDGGWCHGYYTGSMPGGTVAVQLDGMTGSIDVRPIDCSLDAPPAPVESPAIEEQPVSIWGSVPLKSKVMVEIDDVLTEGTLEGVSDSGLSVKLKGSKKPSSFPEDAVTLVR